MDDPKMSQQQIDTHWEKVQTKTFTKWVNNKLEKGNYMPVSNLFMDLCDGTVLAQLLMVLKNEKIQYNTKPYTRIQKMENMQMLLTYIKDQNIKLINIGAVDIVDGNPKLILGLIWTLISRLSILEIVNLDTTIRDELLTWCQNTTIEYNLNITDFSKSWKDGMAFNAIIHKYRPDLLDYGKLSAKHSHKNLEQAFSIAEDQLGISRLIDVEDVADVVNPDERSIMTYVSQYYKKFIQFERENNARETVRDVLKTIDWSIQSRNLYEIKARKFVKALKEYNSKKQGVEELLCKFNASLYELYHANSELLTRSIELHSLLGTINTVHDAYNLKKYVPPSEIALSNLTVGSFNLSDLDSSFMQEVLSALHKNQSKCIDEIIVKAREVFSREGNLVGQIQACGEVYDSILNNPCESEILGPRYDDVKMLTKKKLNVLRSLGVSDKEHDLVAKALELYNKAPEASVKGISSCEAMQNIRKLGLFPLSSVVNNTQVPQGKIMQEEYVNLVRSLYKATFDIEHLKETFKLLSSKDEVLLIDCVGAEGLKNIVALSQGSKIIQIDKFLGDYMR